MKRRVITLALTAAMTLSLAGCGEKKPSLEEVEAAIAAGNVTVEDALEKGWVTQEWFDEYMDSNSVPMSNKLEAGSVGDFTTTTVSGEEFSKSNMGKVTFFAFADPEAAETDSFYQTLVESYEGVKNNGGDIVLCLRSDKGSEKFKEAPFPVIIYNESIKKATENHREMIEGSTIAASWCVDGSFLSAWYSGVVIEDMIESAAIFVEIQQQLENEDNPGGGMASMG